MSGGLSRSAGVPWDPEFATLPGQNGAEWQHQILSCGIMRETPCDLTNSTVQKETTPRPAAGRQNLGAPAKEGDCARRSLTVAGPERGQAWTSKPAMTTAHLVVPDPVVSCTTKLRKARPPSTNGSQTGGAKKQCRSPTSTQPKEVAKRQSCPRPPAETNSSKEISQKPEN